MVSIALLWDEADELAEFKTVLRRALTNLTPDSTDQAATWEWTTAAVYGLALWDVDELRAELVLASDRAALDRVRASMTR